MNLQARYAVVRQAIEVLLRHLESVPPSDEATQLRAWVQDCGLQAVQWKDAPPTDRERDGLMKRLLSLHVEVTRLEQGALMYPANGLAVGTSARPSCLS